MQSREYRSERHHALDCPPCTGLCNQGRNCSAQDREDAQQLESIGQSMPLLEIAQWVGVCLVAFWLFCVVAGWLAGVAVR